MKAKAMETLTPNEISRILKIHPFTVTRLAREKKLPAFKVGGIWRFRKDQFEEWIDQRSNNPRSTPRSTTKVRRSRKGKHFA